MAKGYARKCFQEILQQQREKMSLKELSTRLVKPVSTIEKWLTGQQSPTLAVMSSVCLKLGVDPELLQVTSERFHDLWRRQHLTFEVLSRRYAELDKAGQVFESNLIINLCGVLLVRELSQRGFPMRLSTSDVGDVQLMVIQGGTILHGLYWRVQGSKEYGLQMAICYLKSGNLVAAWVAVNLENITLALQCCSTRSSD